MRTLLTVPDPRLRKMCKEITTIDGYIKELVQEMQKFIRERGVGLAAPQFGELINVFVLNYHGIELALINARVTRAVGEHVVFEQCLSIPGRNFFVKRPKIVKVKGLDINGQERSIKGRDFLAQVLIHEVEHCRGILLEDVGRLIANNKLGG